jgi:hypothetical protein
VLFHLHFHFCHCDYGCSDILFCYDDCHPFLLVYPFSLQFNCLFISSCIMVIFVLPTFSSFFVLGYGQQSSHFEHGKDSWAIFILFSMIMIWWVIWLVPESPLDLSLHFRCNLAKLNSFAQDEGMFFAMTLAIRSAWWDGVHSCFQPVNPLLDWLKPWSDF